MMKVLFAASEIHPLIKTGGLADVAGALPISLRQAGQDVRLIMPAYNGILEKLAPVQRKINLGDPFGTGDIILLESLIPASDTPIWLVQCQSLFERGNNPYLDQNGKDYDDNHIRFAVFSWVTALLASQGNLIGWQADILHLNDWQTGLAAAYLKSWKTEHLPIVSTVHNLRYNGSFPLSLYSGVRLSNELLDLHGMEFFGQFSTLKAALVYSDAITTVSPTYAREILTPEYGDGLDGTLRAHQHKLTGILNGVDYDEWSPEIDNNIAQKYDINNIELKDENKKALLIENGLTPDLSKPVFGVVSRLTEQKGLDLVLEAMPSVIENGARLVLLGSGDPSLERAFLQLQSDYPDQVAVRIGYDEAYSHKIQAGVDSLLIPSRFEPCGLTQLYALKYGTLPLVRKTGGLADTVFELGDAANGFVFEQADTQSLIDTLYRAMDCFNHSQAWRQRQINAMKYDFSWQQTTSTWLNLYQSLLN